MDPLQLFLTLAPSIVILGLAFYFFNLYFKQEEARRRYFLMKDLQKEALPLRLQAYERLTLFLERIQLERLIKRSLGKDGDLNTFKRKLINAIEAEFEHNLSQQLYITNECWRMIVVAKNTTIEIVANPTRNTEIKSIDEYITFLMKAQSERELPSDIGLKFIREEAKKIWIS